MDISGEERINAARDVVWQALNDAEILKQCIPGCQKLEWISQQQLDAEIKVRIGVASITLKGRITLSNIDAPCSYTIAGEGVGGVAGFAKGSADVTLSEDGGVTILHYDAGGDAGGKIAQLGSRLVRNAAAKVAEKFFANFNAVVSATANV